MLLPGRRRLGARHLPLWSSSSKWTRRSLPFLPFLPGLPCLPLPLPVFSSRTLPAPGPGLRAVRRADGEGENGRRSVSLLGLRSEKSLGKREAGRGSGLGCRTSGCVVRRSRGARRTRGETASPSLAQSPGASVSSKAAPSRSASRVTSARGVGVPGAGLLGLAAACCLWTRRPPRVRSRRVFPSGLDAALGKDGCLPLVAVKRSRLLEPK